MECLKLRTELNPGGTRLTRASRRPALRRLRNAALLGGVALLLSGCRMDMHIQPKYLPEWPTNFFGDGRSERQPVPGTVARGELRVDELMYSGTENGVLSNRFPFPITRADLERGRERYNIYCSPCHDYSGTGRGMIVRRGFPQPPSYDSKQVREAPVGQYFQVMTNGFGAMYSYSARVTPADRWRIAAYIRVLQLSRNATIEDVPQAEREKLLQETAGMTPAHASGVTAGQAQ
jgi:Cytochrome C oxidase, cbb3-type, subunit III